MLESIQWFRTLVAVAPREAMCQHREGRVMGIASTQHVPNTVA
jgi:hypothetical protein